MGTATAAARALKASLGWLMMRNRRRCDLALAQPRDQVHSTHARHALIDDEAVAVVPIAVLQQFGAVAKGAHRKAFQLQRKFKRTTDGGIVVDNDDHRVFRFQLKMRHHIRQNVEKPASLH